VFQHWDTATCVDLHDTYGIDLFELPLADRPWWWWRARILGLLRVPTSRILHHLTKEKS
jgi:hypothetical protein